MQDVKKVVGGSRVSMVKRVAVGSVLAIVAGASMAQSGVDVSAATDGLNAVVTAVESIGPLMVGAVAAGIVFKWVIAFLI